jgi:hypothetical protein
MVYLFLDNNVINRLCEGPEKWNQLFDLVIKRIGSEYQVIGSIFSLLEYIGFTKKLLNIPPELRSVIWPKSKGVKNFRDDDDAILELNGMMEKCFQSIFEHIRVTMPTLKNRMLELWDDKRVISWEGSDELRQVLFGDLVVNLKENPSLFEDQATILLAWDAFCGVQTQKVSLRDVRQLQLRYWLKHYDEGLLLPFGKITGDLCDFFKMNFSSFFRPSEDMVDSELITYATVGYRIGKENHEVSCLSLDPEKTVVERFRLGLGALGQIERVLGVELNCKSGDIYCPKDRDGSMSLDHCVCRGVPNDKSDKM